MPERHAQAYVFAAGTNRLEEEANNGQAWAVDRPSVVVEDNSMADQEADPGSFHGWLIHAMLAAAERWQDSPVEDKKNDSGSRQRSSHRGVDRRSWVGDNGRAGQ